MRYPRLFDAPLVDVLLRVELDAHEGIVDGLDAGEVLQVVPVPVPGQGTPELLHAESNIIVKLRQGSGKDRQGMAVKAKGLKA